MKKKLIVFLSCIMTCGVCLSGCVTEGSLLQSSSESSKGAMVSVSVEVEADYQEIAEEAISIQETLAEDLYVEVSIPSAPEYGTSLVQFQTIPDEEKTWETIFGSKEYSVSEHFQSGGMLLKSKDGDELRLGRNSLWLATSQGNDLVTLVDTSLLASRELLSDPYRSFELSERTSMFSEYEGELSSFTRKEAVDLLEPEIEDITGWDVESIELYPVRLGLLEYCAGRYDNPDFVDENVMRGIEVRKDWSEKDEAYYFTVRFSYDGIYLNDDAFSLYSGVFVNPVSGLGFVDRNGLQYFLCDGLNDVSVKETFPLLSGMSAYQQIIGLYSEMILAEPTILTKVELVYLSLPSDETSDERYLQPVWHVTLRGMEDGYHMEHYIDAQSGVRLK